MTDTNVKQLLQKARDNVAADLEELKAHIAAEAKNVSARASGLLVRQQYTLQDLLYIFDQRLTLIDIEAEEARLNEQAEAQRQADLEEAARQEQDHEQALEEAARTKAEALKTDEPLPAADSLE